MKQKEFREPHNVWTPRCYHQSEVMTLAFSRGHVTGGDSSKQQKATPLQCHEAGYARESSYIKPNQDHPEP